jgi:hypothetical protein
VSWRKPAAISLRYFCFRLGHHWRRVSTLMEEMRDTFEEGEGFKRRKHCLVFEFCLVKCGKTPKKVEMRRGELGLSHSLFVCGGGLKLDLKTWDYLGFDKWKSPNQL